MSKYYEELMSLYGADSLKEFVDELETFSSNLNIAISEVRNVLPDLLFVSNFGADNQKKVQLLADYIEDKGNLMRFEGDVNCCFFELGYIDESTNSFSELKRLMDDLSIAAGFRNEYYGVVYIDISHWLDRIEDRRFNSFLECLSANAEKWLIILNINADPKSDREKTAALEAKLSSYLRMRRIDISMPHSDEVLEYILKKIGTYGFEVTADGKDLISESIEYILKNSKTDIYALAGMMCSDIIYSVLSSGEMKSRRLGAEELSDFSAAGDYLKKLTYKKTVRKFNMGFTGGNDNE